jgi:hypothetical protein
MRVSIFERHVSTSEKGGRKPGFGIENRRWTQINADEVGDLLLH